MRTTQLLANATLALSSGMSCLSSAASEAHAANGENLFAFIGEKISLEKQEPPACDRCIIMDQYYVAHYRILDTVFGDYRGNTIAFDVYDHYGEPRFSQGDTVLLFVSRRPNGTWIHEKYQYAELHQGADGEWYGCGDPYGRGFTGQRSVKARSVQFAAPVSYPLTELDPEEIRKYYPAEYFEVRDGRAYCTVGTSVADLFTAKKETVLTARGIFK